MKVSVLIPCHNAERWIGAAIDSALSQSHGEIEVLVHDDGSSDQTLARVKERGNAVRWTSGPNQGAPAARNQLLALARGDWVQYLDADDYLQSDKIRRQLAEAPSSGPEVDVLYGPVTEENGNARRIHAIDENEDPWTHWLRWRIGQPGGLLWRRSALQRIGGWKVGLPCCQDNEICLRALENGLRFAFTPSPGAVYRVWSEETISRRDPERVVHAKTALIDRALAWLDRRELLRPGHLEAAHTAFYAMCRTLAQHDLRAADLYYHERKRNGLQRPAKTPATPPLYRIALQWLGFANAERIAATARSLTSRG